MGYGEKLKKATDEGKTEVKSSVLKEEKKTSKVGRKAKPKKEVRSLNIPFSVSQNEKEWIEKQASDLSKQLNIKISVSAWIRMKALADMTREED